jgi:predicted TIM-barrel fold metal-dependent hydrolase
VIIDFHTHVFPPLFRNSREPLLESEPAFRALYQPSSSKMAGITDLIQAMDEQGILKSVIFGFPWEKEEHYRRHNDYIADGLSRYPERLIGFCCFSPIAEGGAREAERCLGDGFSGVGELAWYGHGLTREMSSAIRDVMAVCAGWNTPVLFHTNEPVGHAYAGKAPITLRQIYRLAETYPDNRIVLAHWGGGLFFYALMKREVKEILRNVWFDTAASPYLYSPEVYSIAGGLVGFDKILFGSDYPLLPPRRYLEEMERPDLPRHAAAKIQGGNAAALLGIPTDSKSRS